MLHGHLDLGIIFSVFTDIQDNRYSQENRRSTDQRKLIISVQLASKAILTLLRNWAGLIYLGDSQVHIGALM
jgi:hypothetical protein